MIIAGDAPVLATENPPFPTVIPAMSLLTPLFWPNNVLDTFIETVSAPTKPLRLLVPLLTASAASRPA